MFKKKITKKEVEIKITEGKAFKLEKGEKYLLFIKKDVLGMDDAQNIMNSMHRMGIDKGLTILIDGNPQDVIMVKKANK